MGKIVYSSFLEDSLDRCLLLPSNFVNNLTTYQERNEELTVVWDNSPAVAATTSKWRRANPRARLENNGKHQCIKQFRICANEADRSGTAQRIPKSFGR